MHSFSLAATDGSETLVLSVPERWADITLDQFLRLFTDPTADPIGVLTCLSPAQRARLHADDLPIIEHRLLFVADRRELEALVPTEAAPVVYAATYGMVQLAEAFVRHHPGRPDLFLAPYLCALLRTRSHDAARVDACYQHLLAQPLLAVYADVRQALTLWPQALQPDAPRHADTLYLLIPESAAEPTGRAAWLWRGVRSWFHLRPGAPAAHRP